MAIEYGSGTLEVTMEGPFGNGSNAARLVCFTAPAANWKGGESPWSQVVEVSAVSASSKVDHQLGPDQLQQLQSGNYEEHHSGLGLKNVHQRIRLYCGEPYGLTFESAAGRGTTVTIRLPGSGVSPIQEEEISR